MLLGFILLNSCHSSAPETVKETVDADSSKVRSIQTIIAKDTVIDGEKGIYLPCSALSFSMDSAIRQEFEDKQYTFIDADPCHEGEATAWLFSIKNYTFQQAHVGMIRAEDEYSLVTGIRAGEEIVIGTPLVENPTKNATSKTFSQNN